MTVHREKSGPGSVSVPIYREQDGYRVAFYLGGKRVRKHFATLSEAKAFAATKSTQTTNGQTLAASLTDADAQVLGRAKALLGSVTIDQAASEYADARSRLGSVPLAVAVDEYLRRHPVDMPARTVPQVATEYMERKRADGASSAYVRILRFRLEVFSEAFPGQISGLSAPVVDSWLLRANHSPQTRLHELTMIRGLVDFAKSRGYLPKSWDELDGLTAPEPVHAAVTIWTPDEMRALLRGFPARYRPVLVLGGFAGVRTAEIARMNWSDITSERVLVAAQKVRSAGRRFIPTLPNLSAWVAVLREDGPVCPVSARALGTLLPRYSRAAGVEWRHNALRHSYISYRLAAVEDCPKVALECGNSPRMIFSRYRELVSAAQAVEWFSIGPSILSGFCPGDFLK